MPARAIRAMYPKSTIVRASAGRSRYFTCVRKPGPGGAWAVTGSHLSATPKTTMSTIEVTNSGTAVSDSPVIVIARSASRAEAKRRDHAAEDAQRDDEDERERSQLERVDKRRAQETLDGYPVYCSDSPKSPRTKCEIQSAYWT